MSAFTDRLYRQWTDNQHRGHGGRGPHGSEAKRRAGYPHGQAKPQETGQAPTVTGRLPTSAAASRDGKRCAKDATSRPEKPAVQSLPLSPFLP